MFLIFRIRYTTPRSVVCLLANEEKQMLYQSFPPKGIHLSSSSGAIFYIQRRRLSNSLRFFPYSNVNKTTVEQKGAWILVWDSLGPSFRLSFLIREMEIMTVNTVVGIRWLALNDNVLEIKTFSPQVLKKLSSGLSGQLIPPALNQGPRWELRD